MAMRFAAKQRVHAIAIVPSGRRAGPQERTFAWPHNPLGVLFEDPRWGCGPAESYEWLGQNGHGASISAFIAVEENLHARKEHPAHHRQEPSTIAPGVVADNRHQHGQHQHRDLHGDPHGNPPAKEHQPDPPANLAIHEAPPSFAGVASSAGSEYSVTFATTSFPYSFFCTCAVDVFTCPRATSFLSRA